MCCPARNYKWKWLVIGQSPQYTPSKLILTANFLLSKKIIAESNQVTLQVQMDLKKDDKETENPTIN